jgi:hypothetical protein
MEAAYPNERIQSCAHECNAEPDEHYTDIVKNTLEEIC